MSLWIGYPFSIPVANSVRHSATPTFSVSDQLAQHSTELPVMGNQLPSLTVLVEGSTAERRCTLPPNWHLMTVQQLKEHILTELNIPPPVQGVSLQVKRRLKAPFQVSREMTMKQSQIAPGKTVILTLNPNSPSTTATQGFFAMRALFHAYRVRSASRGSPSSSYRRTFIGEARQRTAG